MNVSSPSLFRSRVLALTLATLTIFGGRALAQNLVSNGDFELGDFTDWVGTGGTILNNIPLDPFNYGLPVNGTYAAGFGALTADDISQDIATVAGQDYLFTFQFASDGDGIGFNSFQVNWDSDLLYYQTSIPDTLGFITQSYYVTAATTLTKIRFTGSNPDGFYLTLDDVSVTAIPEPSSTAILFGLGSLVSVGLCRRRRVCRN
jgi:hypothetical protein